MATIIISDIEPRTQAAIIAVCKALGVKSYKITKTVGTTASLDPKKLAETKAAVDAHLSGNREGYVSFANTDDLNDAVGI